MHSLPKTEPRFRGVPPSYLPFYHLPDFLYKNHPCHSASWVSRTACGMLPSGVEFKDPCSLSQLSVIRARLRCTPKRL